MFVKHVFLLFTFFLLAANVDGFQSPSQRVANWRSGLQVLASKIESTHCRPFGCISKADWKRSIDELNRKIPELDDVQTTVEFMKLVSTIGDGHTSVFPVLEGSMRFQQIPLMLGKFTDGVFVKAAPKKYRHVVGKKLLRIGRYSTEEAVKRLEKVASSDNKHNLSVITHELHLLVPEILYGAGIISSCDHVELVFESPDGKTISLSITNFAPLNVELFRRLVADKTWISARENAGIPSPQFLKRVRDFPDDFYSYEFLEEPKIVYFQMNVVMNNPRRPLGKFIQDLTAFINENRVDALVIDIRLNGGGNNMLLAPLLEAIERNKKINQDGKLFTIIGNRTFSAAMNFATRLEQNTNTLFVGEPTGSKPNFVGESNVFRLPNTGLQVSISNKYWQDAPANDKRTAIIPTIPAAPSFDDFRSNRDPALEAIVEYLKNMNQSNSR